MAALMVTAVPPSLGDVAESPSSWEIGFDRVVLGPSVGQGVTAHVYQARKALLCDHMHLPTCQALLDGRFQAV
ncbi:unnamed protein product [Effrenium voratum]|nr:unnamed protein product [Effrenium voratum]